MACENEYLWNSMAGPMDNIALGAVEHDEEITCYNVCEGVLSIKIDDILVTGCLYLIVIGDAGRELHAFSELGHGLVEQRVTLPVQFTHFAHQVGIDLMEIHVCYYHNEGKGIARR